MMASLSISFCHGLYNEIDCQQQIEINLIIWNRLPAIYNRSSIVNPQTEPNSKYFIIHDYQNTVFEIVIAMLINITGLVIVIIG